jgi:phage-related tail protein|tara:strand:+ start:86 stop:340 length:255 start_codon:yes stop_codon:yes gene_type:complete
MTPFSFSNISKALNEMKEKLEEEQNALQEGEDVYDKFGIQITKTRLKGGIGYQINYGERGRYIQVLSKDMNNLMKAMQTAMKAK